MGLGESSKIGRTANIESQVARGRRFLLVRAESTGSSVGWDGGECCSQWGWAQLCHSASLCSPAFTCMMELQIHVPHVSHTYVQVCARPRTHTCKSLKEYGTPLNHTKCYVNVEAFCPSEKHP